MPDVKYTGHENTSVHMHESETTSASNRKVIKERRGLCYEAKSVLVRVPSRQNRQKVTLEEGVSVESALKIQCHIHTDTLLHIAFSAILPAGLPSLLHLKGFMS